MIDIKNPKDLRRLQGVALRCQGLTQRQAFGRGKPGTLKAVEHLGYVQIDTISVVERAHHHVMYSRVPGYQPELLNTLLEQRDIFERNVVQTYATCCNCRFAEFQINAKSSS